MQKKERQGALVRLINEISVSNQADLVAELDKRGISVTQASISRDLVELGIRKIHGRYSQVGSNGAGNVFGKLHLTPAGDNLIVGKCLSGLASAITVRIDAERMEQVVGTLAGDDTIFIAVENREARDTALGRIRSLFPSE